MYYSLIILLIFISLLLSFFFSCVETSFTSVNLAKILPKNDKERKNKKIIEDLYENKEYIISTILLGNTFVNILSSAIASGILTATLGPFGLVISSFIVTASILVFAEVLPKTIAINNPENVLMKSAKYVLWISKILHPFTVAIRWPTKYIIKFLGIKINNQNHSPFEIMKNIISLHKSQDKAEKKDIKTINVESDIDIIDNAIDFNKLNVSHAMTHKRDIFSVNMSDKPSKIIENILQSNHRFIPVWKDEIDNITGVIDSKDIMNLLFKNSQNTESIDIGKILLEPKFVPDTTKLYHQLNRFRDTNSRLSIIVDEYGELQGLITLRDIMEEIIGEINDDKSQDSYEIIRLADGSYIADGNIQIRELGRNLDIDFPTYKDVSTLAGLIIHSIERIPSLKEKITLHNCIFNIMRMDSNRIIAVGITKLDDTRNNQDN